MMTWAEFKTKVKENLPADASRLGPVATYIDNQIRIAVIDLQRAIDGYRVGHVNFYEADDLVEHNYASLGQLPEQAQVRDIFFVGSDYSGHRHTVWPYDWGNRHDLIYANVNGGQYSIAIDPRDQSFVVYPQVKNDDYLEVHWDGLKLIFADSDETPFNEQMADCAASYVSAKLAKKVDNDIVMAREYMEDYRRSARLLRSDERDEASIREKHPSPQTTGYSIPCTLDDTVIEFAAIGDFGLEGDNAEEVSRLVKSWNPDFVLMLGDNNYPDGATRTLNDNLLQYFSAYIPGKSYPVWGERDLTSKAPGSSQYGSPLFQIFTDIDDLNSDKLYYKFTKGPATFFVINSGYSAGDPREPDGITSGSTQDTWLQAALTASSSEWNVILCHKPPYSSDDTLTPGETGMRWNFGMADLIMSAHSYTYERIHVGNLVYIVNGIGGAGSLGTITTPLDGSRKRYTADYGAMRFAVTSTRLQCVLYNVQGKIIDNISLRKET